jgi:hypothetical protein
VFLGDPSYVGTVSDLAGHAAAAHAAGVPLIVDAAWAAHLGFHPELPRHAIAAGAKVLNSQPRAPSCWRARSLSWPTSHSITVSTAWQTSSSIRQATPDDRIQSTTGRCHWLAVTTEPELPGFAAVVMWLPSQGIPPYVAHFACRSPVVVSDLLAAGCPSAGGLTASANCREHGAPRLTRQWTQRFIWRVRQYEWK